MACQARTLPAITGLPVLPAHPLSLSGARYGVVLCSATSACTL